MIPDYLTDQNEDYIKAKGYSFRDFSAEQILSELRFADVMWALHGHKTLKKHRRKLVKDGKESIVGMSTIIDNVPPKMGAKTRHKYINPYNCKYFVAYAGNKTFKKVRVKKFRKKYLTNKLNSVI